MSNYVFIGMMLIGLFFVFTSAIGVLKFPDVYTRLHAISKGTTFGFGFMLLGAAFLIGDETDMAKTLLAILFQFFTAPISAHMIARVALRRGIKPVSNSKEKRNPTAAHHVPSPAE